MKKILFLLPFLLAACVETTEPNEAPKQEDKEEIKSVIPEKPVAPYGRFAEVVANVRPVGERICRGVLVWKSCNFAIMIDPERTKSKNAHQTETQFGRPAIIFTQGLINSARNEHELALVLAHEMAHHIHQHLEQQAETTYAGALLVGGLATLQGATGKEAEEAIELGAKIGSRTFSKKYELEADKTGTAIAELAGYDATIGLRLFTQIPDPGNKYLGSHPPHRDRIRTIREEAAKY